MLDLSTLEGSWERRAYLIDGDSVRGPIQLDERWKQELPRRERLLFALTASPLNVYLQRTKSQQRGSRRP